ncbi:MAG: hypothetical protein IJT79_00850 [Ruminococcus sp.]|nr:hypothetical protein [Ruminococcus sp.]
MKSKVIALLLALVLMGASSVVLSSCGKNDEENISSEVEETETTEPFKEIEWPDSELANLIPKPKSTFGRIEWEYSDDFKITLGKITKQQYQDYVKECKEKGFKEDYEKGEDYYRAENKDGYYLSLDYEEGDIMTVHLESPYDDGEDSNNNEDEETESKNKTSSKSKSSSKAKSDSSKVSAGFKKTMDEYEAFMDDYVDFMKKYKKSSDVAAMLTEYTEMMSKYTDFTEKIDDIDEDSLSTADAAYYVEVTARVAKKLAEVAD